jgi:hypothetical protein
VPSQTLEKNCQVFWRTHTSLGYLDRAARHVEMKGHNESPSNVALKLPAQISVAAGSLRSPAALLVERRSLTPAR